jgi:superfamily II DNA or RNA helicase
MRARIGISDKNERTMLTSRGYETSSPEDVARARRELVFTPIVATTTTTVTRKVRAYVELDGSGILAPRFWDAARGARDIRHEGDDASFEFVGNLRDDLRQREAVDAVYASWKESGGGAVLALPTGFGKTTVALYLAAALKKKTLVLVAKNFLKEQWAERAASFVPAAKVTFVQGHVWDESGDIVIAMMQTIASRRKICSERFGLVIADEAHHIAADILGKTMFACCAKRVLGLSATPERKDGLSSIVHLHLGPLAFHANIRHASHVRVETVTYTSPRYALPMPLNRRGDVDYARVMNSIAADPDRTDMVVETVRRIAMGRGGTLVLSHRREHCKAIADALGAKGIDVGLYLGGTKGAPPASTVVVATYALVSEGYDDPRLSALVLATPASDVVQACGRIMRGGSRTGEDRVVVDIVDAFGIARGQHAKRKKYYASAGFTYENRPTQQCLL